MITFLTGLALPVVGAVIYGSVCERVMKEICCPACG